MFSDLLPPCVAVAEGLSQEIDGSLWPEEAEHIVKAVDGRRTEFTAGRVLARRAIAMLGGGDYPIPPGSRNMPVWPAGFVGSISHAHGFVAAAAARKTDLLSVGIDVENALRFRPELEKKIVSTGEITRNFHGLARDARQIALAIVFSAKEAFYKCQYPITERYLGFHDAEVVIDREGGVFRLRLLADAPELSGRQVFDGRFAIAADTVYTAMAMNL
jgi:4'-phosphopantetheinyl transferase EntD